MLRCMVVTVKSAAKKAPLDAVKNALEASHTSQVKQRSIRQKKDFAVIVLIFTGVLCFLQISILGALNAQAALGTLASRHSFQLSINGGAQESQAHAFLQALLALPPVDSVQYLTKEQQLARMNTEHPGIILNQGVNPASDRVEVTLGSASDFPAFFAFLKRPELQSVLSPQYLMEFPLLLSKLQSDFSILRTTRLLSLLGAALCLGLLFLLAMQSVRGRMIEKSKQIQTLSLLGAAPGSVNRPFFYELLSLFIGALLLSLMLTGIGIFLFRNIFDVSIFLFLPIVLLEVIVLAVISFLAVRMMMWQLPSR